LNGHKICPASFFLHNGEDAMIKTTSRGVHDRPNKSAFTQSGPGLPDDASQPVEATEEEALRIQSKLEGTDKKDEANDLARQLARPKHGTA
jgi:hypothetical protein